MADGAPSQADLAQWSQARQLHVSTLGRRTGIWRDKWWLVFAVATARTIYLLEEAGADADWVRNIQHDPTVRVWVDGVAPVAATARVVTDPQEELIARRAVAKTAMGSTLRDLVEWGLPIAIDLP